MSAYPSFDPSTVEGIAKVLGEAGSGTDISRYFQTNGLLDDSEECQKKEIFGRKVLGKIDSWPEFNASSFVVAVGSPRVRQAIVTRMTSGSEQPDFATLFDPSAIIGENVKFGKGSIICAGVVATVEISAGEHVIVNLNSTIGHETIIGDFVTIAPLVAVSGKVELGDLVEIGTGAAIRQGVVVGHGSMLGMGGILTKNMAEYCMHFGNPAKFFKEMPQ